MIITFIFKIIGFVLNVIFSIIPDINILPEFVTSSLEYLKTLILASAGLIKWLVTPLVFNAALDYLGFYYGIKIYFWIIKIIKRFVLFRGE